MNLSSDGLAQILSQLFLPDTEVVKTATTLLKLYFKKEESVENLLILMAQHPETNVR